MVSCQIKHHSRIYASLNTNCIMFSWPPPPKKKSVHSLPLWMLASHSPCLWGLAFIRSSWWVAFSVTSKAVKSLPTASPAGTARSPLAPRVMCVCHSHCAYKIPADFRGSPASPGWAGADQLCLADSCWVWKERTSGTSQGILQAGTAPSFSTGTSGSTPLGGK